MAKDKNTQGISVKFDPFTKELGFMLTELKMYEKIGGAVAVGEASFLHQADNQDALDEILKSKTGKVKVTDETDEGLSFSVDIFITKREYYGKSLKIGFFCSMSEEFNTKVKTATYKGVDAALKSIFPNEKKRDIRTKTSISKDLDIRQNNITDCDLARNLCSGYNSDIIFAFGWDGLLIKDIYGGIDHNGDKEPKIEVKAGDILHAVDSGDLEYKTNLNYTTINAWTKDSLTKKDYEEPEYVTSVVNNTGYSIVAKDYVDLSMNSINNMILMESEFYTKVLLKSQKIPNFKLGDVVNYTDLLIKSGDNNPLPFKKYLVYSNSFSFIGQGAKGKKPGFTWGTVLVGIEKSECEKSSEEQKEERRNSR